MKVGFIANNGLEQIRADCQLANELGYDGLEFNYWGNFKDLTEETVRDMRSILDEHGVGCSTLGAWGWNHISADAEERRVAHAQAERGIRFAQILGAPVFITGGGKLEGASIDGMLAEWAKVMRPYVDQANAAGIQLALYGFHGGSCLDTVDAYAQLLSLVPEVGIKYDPANIDHAGQDYIRMLRELGGRVAHVHIKDHLNHQGQVAAQPSAGMGDIQFGKVMAFLYENDYDGYLTVEPHGPKWSRDPLRRTMLTLTRRYLGQFLV